MSFYPYADRYPVMRGLPSEGRDRKAILNELREMADLEDAKWETGKASGSFYCGDHDHYEFMGEAYSMYSHMNAMQRDVCPSATRFEGEIIAMGLDLMHASAATDAEPCGMLTSGGSGSILHAMFAYREQATRNGIDKPNIVKPETAHPAFDKACHLFGMEMRHAPIDPGHRSGRSRRDGVENRSTTTPQRSSDRPATTDTAPSIRSTSFRHLALRSRRRPARRRLPRRVPAAVR